MAIVCDLPESFLQLQHRLMRRVFRSIFFMLIVTCAWLLIDHLIYISAFMGSVLTLCISMLCPLLGKLCLDFYKSSVLTTSRRMLMSLVLAARMSLSAFMLYVDCVDRPAPAARH